MKVLVVGFDGATWDLIKRWTEEGWLPTFRYLMNNGCWGDLESTIPPITIPAWISMFSGKNPGKIGAIDFKIMKLNSDGWHTRLTTSKNWMGQLVWDLLSRHKIKSLVLNIPGTYPPYPINGHIITLDFAPWTGNTYPNEIENILYSEFNLDKVKKIQEVAHKGKDAVLAAIHDEESKILEILLDFSKTYNYDVVFVRFGIPDHVSHHSTDDDDMLKFHIFMDNILKKILAILDFDLLIIVSDHGIEKSTRRFNINNVLRKCRLLKLRWSKLYLLLLSCLSTIVIKYFHKIASMVYYLVSRSKSEDIIAGGVAGERISFALVNWNKTRAFGYSSVPTVFCPIYTRSVDVNEVVENLRNSEYYSNIIEKIIRTSELYNGVYLDQFPKIIIKTKIPVFPHISLKDIMELKSYYTHSLHGIFLAYGKDIKKGNTIKGAKIYDIAPTILHILGLPIPKDMDGRVLVDIFEPDSKFTKRKPIYVDPNYYEKNEKEKIHEKIRKFKFTKKFGGTIDENLSGRS